MSNYERIKAMSFEEMARFLSFFNREEDMCSRCNAHDGGDYCHTHTCIECAKKYLEEDSTDNSTVGGE